MKTKKQLMHYLNGQHQSNNLITISRTIIHTGSSNYGVTGQSQLYAVGKSYIDVCRPYNAYSIDVVRIRMKDVKILGGSPNCGIKVCLPIKGNVRNKGEDVDSFWIFNIEKHRFSEKEYRPKDIRGLDVERFIK